LNLFSVFSLLNTNDHSLTTNLPHISHLETENRQLKTEERQEGIAKKAKLVRRVYIPKSDGKVIHPVTGTPQGGIVSPILANIYLHFVLDLWFEKKVKPNCKGEAYLCRYADDFICAFRFNKIFKLLNVKLRGYYNYYGVIGNFASLQKFFFLAMRILYKWLNRRSQRRSFCYTKFNVIT